MPRGWDSCALGPKPVSDYDIELFIYPSFWRWLGSQIGACTFIVDNDITTYVALLNFSMILCSSVNDDPTPLWSKVWIRSVCDWDTGVMFLRRSLWAMKAASGFWWGHVACAFSTVGFDRCKISTVPATTHPLLKSLMMLVVDWFTLIV